MDRKITKQILEQMYISETKFTDNMRKTWDSSTYRNVDWKILEGQCTQNLQTENTTTADIHIALQNAGDKTRNIKMVDSPRTVPRRWKVFWTALLDGGQGLLVYGVAMLRVWNQLNQYHINVTNTMYKSVYNKILWGVGRCIPAFLWNYKLRGSVEEIFNKLGSTEQSRIEHREQNIFFNTLKY